MLMYNLYHKNISAQQRLITLEHATPLLDAVLLEFNTNDFPKFTIMGMATWKAGPSVALERVINHNKYHWAIYSGIWIKEMEQAPSANQLFMIPRPRTPYILNLYSTIGNNCYTRAVISDININSIHPSSIRRYRNHSVVAKGLISIIVVFGIIDTYLWWSNTCCINHQTVTTNEEEIHRKLS